MKLRSKLATISILAICVIAGVTAGFAQSQRGARTSAPSQPTASPARLKAPAGTARGKVVGACNTARGCAVLKDACLTLKGHTFKSTGASSGACVADSRKAPNNPSADVGLSTPEKVSEATLYCNGVALCTKVKNACKILGGTYTPTPGHSGQCTH